MTATMTKSVIAGNLHADAMGGALATVKSWTMAPVQYTADTSRITVVTEHLARALIQAT